MTLVDDLSEHATRLRRRMGPLRYKEEVFNYSTAALADALSGPTDLLNDVVRAGLDYEAWERAVDPSAGPSWVLKWLGAVVGAGVADPHLFEAEYNLVKNVGAEVDVTDWTGSNATLARVTTDQRTGAGAFRITSSAAGVYSMIVSGASSRYPAKAGQAYSASAYVKAGSAGAQKDVDIQLVFKNLAGTTLTSVAGVAVPSLSTAYVRAVVENQVAPATTATVEINIRVTSAAAAAEVTYIDDVMLNLGPVAQDYFSGATVSPTPDHVYSWVNASNASYSIHQRMQTTEEWAVEARDRIVNRPLWRRGTPLYARAQILASLDHVATIDDVRLLPRTSGPWRDTLVITAARCPNQTRTTAVAMTEKPAMREWTVTYTNGYVINEMTRLINNITAKVDQAALSDVT